MELDSESVDKKSTSNVKSDKSNEYSILMSPKEVESALHSDGGKLFSKNSNPLSFSSDSPTKLSAGSTVSHPPSPINAQGPSPTNPAGSIRNVAEVSREIFENFSGRLKHQQSMPVKSDGIKQSTVESFLAQDDDNPSKPAIKVSQVDYIDQWQGRFSKPSTASKRIGEVDFVGRSYKQGLVDTVKLEPSQGKGSMLNEILSYNSQVHNKDSSSPQEDTPSTKPQKNPSNEASQQPENTNRYLNATLRVNSLAGTINSRLLLSPPNEIKFSQGVQQGSNSQSFTLVRSTLAGRTMKGVDGKMQINL